MKLLLFLVLLSSVAVGQQVDKYGVPDCAEQLVQMKIRFQEREDLLLKTRKAGDAIISDLATVRGQFQQANKAVAIAVGKQAIAESDLADFRSYVKEKSRNDSTSIAAAKQQAKEAKEELYKWKPKTKAGLFFRKVRNTLAIVGGVAVVGIVPILSRIR